MNYSTFILSLFLTIMWGIYLAAAIRDYARLRVTRDRRRQDLVVGLRRLIVALCVFTLPAAVLVRSVAVFFGMGTDVIVQITFFALAGPNVVGCIYAVLSLRYD